MCSLCWHRLLLKNISYFWLFLTCKMCLGCAPQSTGWLSPGHGTPCPWCADWCCYHSPLCQPRYSQSIWPARWCQSISSRSVSAQKQPLEQPCKKKKFHFDVLVSTRVAPTESVPALTITRASLQGPAFSLTKLLHVVQNNKDTEGSRRKRNDFFILWLGLLQSREEIWFWILQCFHASHSTSGMLWIEAQGNVVVSSEPHNAHRCCSTLLALMYSCTVCLTAPDLWSMCIPKGHGVARKSKIIWKHHT